MATKVGTGVIVIEADASDVPSDIKNQTGPAGKAGRSVGDAAGEGVDDGLAKGTSNVPSLGSRIGSEFTSAMGTALKFGAATAGTAVAATMGVSLTKGFQRLTALDNAEAKLSGLGYTSKEVSGVMDDALAAVKGTAFGMGDAATQAAGLMAAGIKPGKELEDTLTLVGDAATIAGVDFNDMGSIFGKVAATGKLQGDELAQLSDMGIPALQLLSDQMGTTAADTADMVSKGEVDFATFSAAMEKGLGGAAQESGKTFQGAMANMNAALGRLGAGALEGAFEGMKPVFAGVTSLIDGLTEALGPLFDKMNGAIGPAMERFGGFLGGIGEGLKTMDFSGVSGMFSGISGALGPLLGMLSPLLQYLPKIGGAFKGVSVLGGGLVGLFVQMFAESGTLRDAMGDLFGVIGSLLEALGPVIGLVGEAFGTLAGTLGDVLGEAIKAVVPMLEALIQFLGPVLIQILEAVLPPVMDFVQMLGGLLVDALKMLMPVFLQLVRAVLPVLLDVIDALLPIIGDLLEALGPAFMDILGALMPVLGALLPIFVEIVQAITPLIESLMDLLIPAFEYLMPVVETVIGYIATAIEGLLGIIMPVIDAIVAVFQGDWAGAWESLKEVPAAAFEALKELIGAALEVIASIFGTSVEGLKTNWNNFWNGLGAVVSSVWEGIKGAISTAWDWIRDNVFAPIGSALSALGTAFSGAKDAVLRVWGNIRDGLKAGWDWIKGKVLDAFNRQLRGWQAVFAAVKDAVLRIWNNVKDGLYKAWTWIKEKVLGAFNTALNNWKSHFNAIKDGVLTIWRALRDGLKTVWDWISKHVLGVFKTGLSNLQTKFSNIRDGIKKIWGNLRDGLKDVWDWINKHVFSKMKSGVGAIKDAFSKAKDGISKVWNKVKEIAAKPVNFMINTVYTKGIKKLVDGVFKALGMKTRMPTVSPIKGYDAGGYTGPGGKNQPAGIVHADEYVVKKSSRRKFERKAPGALDHLNRYGSLPGYAKGGTVAMLRKAADWWAANGARIGEFRGYPGSSVSPVHMKNSLHYTGHAFDANYGPGGENATEKAFFDKMMPQFAKVFPAISVIWRRAGHFNHAHFDTSGNHPNGGKGGKVSGGGGWGFDFFGVIDKLKKLKTNLSGLGGGMFGDMLKSAAKRVISSPIDWIKEKASGFIEGAGEAVSATVQKGAVYAQVKEAARKIGGGLLGWSVGANWDAIAHIIDRESGWNPNAKNPTSSAAGLFQKMQSVHGPVESNAYDQAMWGIRYIRDRYGTPVKAWDFWKRNHHYDSGGWLPDGGMGFNTTGKPEAVLNPAQSQALVEMSKALTSGSSTTAAALATTAGTGTGEGAEVRLTREDLDYLIGGLARVLWPAARAASIVEDFASMGKTRARMV